MAVVRELIARFRLKTDPESVERAGKSLGNLVGAAEAAAKVVQTLFRGFRALALGTAEMGDRIDKTAQRIGVSTRALQELQFAANLAGASNADVETGLRTLAKSALEASQGVKSYAQDFEKLGVTVTGADGSLRAVDAIMQDVARGMARLGSDTERTALAQSLLGRSGTRLLPLLKQGEDALAAQREEAGQLGILTDDLIRLSVEFTDNQRRVAGAMQIVKNTISQALLPFLIRGQRSVIDWVKANREWIQLRLGRAVERVGQALERFSSFVDRIVAGIGDWLDKLGPLQRQILGISLGVAALAALLLLPGGSILLLLGLLGLLVDDFEAWRKGHKSVIGSIVGDYDDLEKRMNDLRTHPLAMLVEGFMVAAGAIQDALFTVIVFISDAIEFDLATAADRGIDNIIGIFERRLIPWWKKLAKRLGDIWIAALKGMVTFAFDQFAKLNDFLTRQINRLIAAINRVLEAVPGATRIEALVLGAAAVPAVTAAGAVQEARARPPGPRAARAGVAFAPRIEANISIQAAPGMSEAALADETARRTAALWERKLRAAMRSLTPVVEGGE